MFRWIWVCGPLCFPLSCSLGCTAQSTEIVTRPVINPSLFLYRCCYSSSRTVGMQKPSLPCENGKIRRSGMVALPHSGILGTNQSRLDVHSPMPLRYVLLAFSHFVVAKLFQGLSSLNCSYSYCWQWCRHPNLSVIYAFARWRLLPLPDC